VEERHTYIMESTARAAQQKAEKKPIAERLKEGAAQAERDNAPAAPAKNYGKGQITELRANLARSRKKEVFS
jgi:hypothetical protein